MECLMDAKDLQDGLISSPVLWPLRDLTFILSGVSGASSHTAEKGKSSIWRLQLFLSE